MRVLLGEDSRVKDSPRYACSAVAAVVESWAANAPDGALEPESLIIGVYHEPTATVEAYRY